MESAKYKVGWNKHWLETKKLLLQYSFVVMLPVMMLLVLLTKLKDTGKTS